MNEQERNKKVAAVLRRRVQGSGGTLTGAYPSFDDAVRRISGTEKLTFYLGIDPTGAALHLGHTIPLLLLADLAELGHDSVLLIGDFTARIGDPTGRGTARGALSEEEIVANMATYTEQAKKVTAGADFRVAYNSEWLSGLTMQEVLKLTGMVTVQQMLARDMFQEREKAEKPIYLNEFLYPLMQGYDSVALRTDGEVGGNDQTFNMLVGRELERELLGKDKIVLATKLLVDKATGKKMSKSEGALIAVTDSPQEIRRKILNIDDRMIKTVFLLCTQKSQEWIDQRCPEEEAPPDPRGFKEELAAELVRMYHGPGATQEAQKAIEVPITGGAMPLDRVVKEFGGVRSMTEAKTLINQGAVSINGTTVHEWERKVQPGDEIRIGKGKLLKGV